MTYKTQRLDEHRELGNEGNETAEDESEEGQGGEEEEGGEEENEE